MDNLNIEVVLDEVRKELAKNAERRSNNIELKSVEESLLETPSEITAYQLQREKYELFEHLNHEYVLEDYQDMGTGLKGAIKKTIQRAVRLITVPLAKQQSLFNSYSVQSFNMLRRENESLNGELQLLRSRIDEQEQLINEYQTQLNRVLDVVNKLAATSK